MNTELHDQYKWILLSEAPEITDHAGAFLSVFFSDKSNGIGISQISIEKTSDGGINWTAVQNWESDQGFSSLFHFEQKLWIVGTQNSKPLILFSSDREGANWNDWKPLQINWDSHDTKFTSFSNICFTASGNAWLTGDGEIIELVIDSDLKGARVSSFFTTESNFTTLSCEYNGEVWAGTADGKIFHSGKNGWIEVIFPNPFHISKIFASKDGIFFAGWRKSKDDKSRLEGVLMGTIDKGKTWENLTPESSAPLHDLYFTDNNGWSVGSKGEIYVTLDKGKRWEKQTSPTTNDLVSFSFRDSKSMWITGDRNTVLGYFNNKDIPNTTKKTVWAK